MKQRIVLFFALVGLVSTGILIGSWMPLNTATTDNPTPTSEKKVYDLPQIIKGIPSIDNLNFAGESIPMNIDTKERMDREFTVNSYYHSSTILNIKLAKKYFPIIEPILRENGVPDDFKYLAVAESGLRNVTSPAGAKGFWQFRAAAAEEMGLEVNGEVDERYHLEKSTEAAAQYLLKLYKKFGSWIEAAAAYNMGPTGLSNAMESQGAENYFDLNINEETSRYIFRLIALKEIMKSPSSFGFYLEPEDHYDPIDDVYIVTVDKSVPSWGDFAADHGISYKILKYYNPWLLDNKLTVIKNVYQIKIPRDKG